MSETEIIKEFIKSYITPILAFLAFIQYWIEKLWKKYVQKGSLDIHKTGTVKIGYSAFGPLIELKGTLRALNQNLFIKSIDLLIVREKDRAQHVFNWFAFQSLQILPAGDQSDALENPAGFSVPPDSPYRYNILFNDSTQLKDMQPALDHYYKAWYEKVELLNKIKLYEDSQRDPLEAHLAASLVDALDNSLEDLEPDDIIRDFRDDKVYLDTYTELDGKCYWEVGDYSLTINTRTSKPDRVYSKNYHFTIDEDQAKSLKLNVIAILMEPIYNYLKIPRQSSYYFVYAEYR